MGYGVEYLKRVSEKIDNLTDKEFLELIDQCIDDTKFVSLKDGTKIPVASSNESYTVRGKRAEMRILEDYSGGIISNEDTTEVSNNE